LSISAIFGGVICVVIAALVWLVLRRRAGVRFKSFDEAAVLQQLMFWAAPKVPGRGRQLLWLNAMSLMPFGFVALKSISREDLAILAPYIDEWIEGRLPSQNLPAEYEDHRPRVLLAFKRRLQSEGLWPLGGRPTSPVAPERRA
jgi:hypothetical protein